MFLVLGCPVFKFFNVYKKTLTTHTSDIQWRKLLLPLPQVPMIGKCEKNVPRLLLL
jgi:hypothetical protein